MGMWLVIGLAALGMGAALIAFLRTPPHLRYRLSTPPQPEDYGQYADQYTRRERIRYAAIAGAIGLPLIGATELWGFPALRAFAETAHCREIGGISGTAWLLYGLFVGLPLSMALAAGVPAAFRGLRIIKNRQSPPPGTKVFQRTRIRHGTRAILTGYGHLLPLIAFVGIAAWGAVQPGKILASHDPGEADRSVCEPGGQGRLSVPGVADEDPA